MSRSKKALSEKADYTHLLSIGFFSLVVPKSLMVSLLI
jgi:hypothetical protein